jgi:hypothetical protein
MLSQPQQTGAFGTMGIPRPDDPDNMAKALAESWQIRRDAAGRGTHA